jgi:type IV pilus assembly protein PilV
MPVIVSTTSSRRGSAGMSLIEVLVSLIILSVGILAVIALQLISKRNNADAGQRTIAAQLASNIIEKMRSNSRKDAAGSTVSTALASYVTSAIGRAQIATEPTPECTLTAHCDTTQLALHDLWQWEREIDGFSERDASGVAASGLLQASACITPPAAGAGTSGFYTVTLVWRGTVKIPPTGLASDTCALDPQPGGASLYSYLPGDNLYRRTVAIPVYIYLKS